MCPRTPFIMNNFHRVSCRNLRQSSLKSGIGKVSPDYWTQGETLDDLKDHLRDLYHDLTSGELPGIRKVDELVVS